MKINCTVHSYQEGSTIVNATVGGQDMSVMTEGATVELIDDLGTCRTYRMTDVIAARELFTPNRALVVTIEPADVEVTPDPAPETTPAPPAA